MVKKKKEKKTVKKKTVRHKAKAKTLSSAPKPKRIHHKNLKHHQDHVHITKVFLLKTSIISLVLIAFFSFYNIYIKKTAIYYRYFKMSDLFFNSLNTSTFSSIAYFSIFLIALTIIFIIVSKKMKLLFLKHSKKDVISYSFIAGGFLFGNILLKTWVNDNYIYAIDNLAVVQGINSGTMLLFLIVLTMTLFGYRIKKHN